MLVTTKRCSQHGKGLLQIAGAVWLMLMLLLCATWPGTTYAAAQSIVDEPSLADYIANAQRVVRVQTTTELVAAIQKVIPGDVVILSDGVYSGDAILTVFNQRATAENPIVIIAENQGQAVLKGKLRFEVNYSSYVTIWGLVFNTQGAGANDDSGAITIKHSHHVRITRNQFSLQEQRGARADIMLDWVVVRGAQSKYNRIDHNLFANKLQRGRFIIVSVLSATDTMPQYTRIDHNHFRDMAPLRINGMEAVVIGGGHPISPHYLNDQDAFTVFEYNLMERVDGECAEIISLKSSGNEIRYNTIVDTNGSIYFRTGNRNAVYGNYFLGHNKSGSGGVRIYGEDQKVMHNYFSQLDMPAVWFGDAEVPFFNPATDVAPFTQVSRAEVAFNTFVDTGVALGRHLRENAPYTPVDSSIHNNLLYSSTKQKLIDPLLLKEPGITWWGNIAYAESSSREEQITGLSVPETQVRWINPLLVRSGFYPDYIYSIGADSPARNAAQGSISAGLTDIEGKTRDATPDVGAFEYAGYPPLRGFLTPEDVRPDAIGDLGTVTLKTPDLVLIGISLAGEERSASWYGPVEFTVSTAASGLTQPIQYHVQVDGQGMQTFTSATFSLNVGELSDGAHQVRVVARSGDLLDEAQVSFTVANTRIVAPRANEVLTGTTNIQVESSLPAELIQSVRLSVDSVVIYQGAQLPPNVSLQTTDLADSYHTLELEVRVLGEVVSRATGKFRTANYWRQEITFAAPQLGWFFSSSADETQMTAGWRYAATTQEALFGDPSRLVRTGNTTESCTWSTPQLTKAVISIYARTEQLGQHIRVVVSTDGEHWQEAAYTLQTIGTATDWYELELRIQPEAGLYHYLRLTALAGDLPAEDIQLGHAVLEGLNR
jgi:hypothetical protein